MAPVIDIAAVAESYRTHMSETIERLCLRGLISLPMKPGEAER